MLLDLQSTDDIRDMVHRTVQALVEGQIVGFPTETVYVLAAHSLCGEAVSRLRKLEADVLGNAGAKRPMVLSLRSREAAEDFLFGSSSLVRRLTSRCWPGPMTLRVACDPKGSALAQLPKTSRDLLVDEHGQMSFRVVDQRILSHVHRYLAAPLVLLASDSVGRPVSAASDTNGSGSVFSPKEPPLPRVEGTATHHASDSSGSTDADSISNATALSKFWGDRIPLLLDDGPTRYGGCSTVVDVRHNRWNLLLEGVIEKAAMSQFAKPVIAVVCTGNTCRSPMAEVLLVDLLQERLGTRDAVRVLSAGVAAGNGSEASPQAVAVMREHGLDLSNHGSRMLDDTLVGTADLILTMTRGHRAAILAAWPELNGRVFTLRRDGGDVTDPVGMPVEVYRQCAEQIKQELTSWLDSLGDDFFPKEIDSDESPESDTPATT